jgi:flagellar hook-associated protein 2
MLATDGLLAGQKDGINKSIADIGKQRIAVNVRLAALQKQYTSQFSALDVMLSNMTQTSTYLTQQLANLSKGY